ncbi:Rrf2 family transcriptional regulator [Campylobacter sp. RM13119]|uniref:Rrf2 family transcriptional regulator n=1 Tax=Campylobacter californiensis TaxID=1032243 RepID=A0ABD4JKJ7_9BACT|nr:MULTISPECIES: Rrf2 family transcriptional regulator [unclassified Campylobacter]MBE2987239.1 Rrf2 family transcriptional regulator [Campylobacter sp. RM12919]MBE2988914.1 Rrf2 family transcriptional regulator [Campylobacter sp. RM12920]MBE3022998.1 Rrf2 family transcriptional regulator [Campylobacter sp. 7477a]MBE3606993.1 Rrf2 family transcriptional regulator [Campylobacter sp. RM13119]MBE3610614.1 Rrf2 family transcriptional regulator [Campylobacter sp. RM12916]
MQIGQKFSIAIHILLSCEYFKDEKNTSEFLADTVGTNPVIIRNIIALLKRSNLVITRAGVGGINLAKSPSEISLFDIFMAVNDGERDIFKIHKNSPPPCPLGGKIQSLLTPKFKSAQQAMFDSLASASLQKLLDELNFVE